jgi:hypothetical protein
MPFLVRNGANARVSFTYTFCTKQGVRLDLSKVSYRESLKAQREPHWQRLRNGCFIGFRAFQARRGRHMDCPCI